MLTILNNRNAAAGEKRTLLWRMMDDRFVRFVLILLLSACTPLAGATVDDVSAPGVEYRHLSAPGPRSIHVVSFDLARKDLTLAATAGAGVWGNETVPDMVAGLDPAQGRPVAAINGDYFEFQGEPRYFGTVQGMCIAQGELIAAPPASAFWVDAQGRPRLGSVASRLVVTWPDERETPFSVNCSSRDFKSEVRAAEVTLYTPAFGPSTHAAKGAREWVLAQPAPHSPWLPLRPDHVYTARVSEVRLAGDTPVPDQGMVLSLARAARNPAPSADAGETLVLRAVCEPSMAGVETAIGGAPMLLRDGRLLTKPGKKNRAPRTAVGLAGTRVWLVVVDGRQPNAVGMSHHELAEFMRSLGCTDAMNLDGGGSSALWYGGKLVNAPSDGAPRPVGNALVLLAEGRRDEK
jgi:hypothetical protein